MLMANNVTPLVERQNSVTLRTLFELSLQFQDPAPVRPFTLKADKTFPNVIGPLRRPQWPFPITTRRKPRIFQVSAKILRWTPAPALPRLEANSNRGSRPSSISAGCISMKRPWWRIQNYYHAADSHGATVVNTPKNVSICFIALVRPASSMALFATHCSIWARREIKRSFPALKKETMVRSLISETR